MNLLRDAEDATFKTNRRIYSGQSLPGRCVVLVTRQAERARRAGSEAKLDWAGVWGGGGCWLLPLSLSEGPQTLGDRGDRPHLHTAGDGLWNACNALSC